MVGEPKLKKTSQAKPRNHIQLCNKTKQAKIKIATESIYQQQYRTTVQHIYCNISTLNIVLPIPHPNSFLYLFPETLTCFHNMPSILGGRCFAAFYTPHPSKKEQQQTLMNHGNLYHLEVNQLESPKSFYGKVQFP